VDVRPTRRIDLKRLRMRGGDMFCFLSMRSALALLYCGFRLGLLHCFGGVRQTVAAFDQHFQPTREACCRCAVDDLVITTDRQAQVVPDRYLPVHDPWLLANPAYRHPERWRVAWRNTPPGPFAKHAHCREGHRPHVFLQLPGIPPHHPQEEAEEEDRH